MPRKVAPKTASKAPGKKPSAASAGVRAIQSSPARHSGAASRATTATKPVPKKSSAKPASKAAPKAPPKLVAPPRKPMAELPASPPPPPIVTPEVVAPPPALLGPAVEGLAIDAVRAVDGIEPKTLSGASAVAAGIVAELQTAQITALGAHLLDERTATATQAARVLEEVLALKPEMLVTVIDRFVVGVLGENPRVVQTCAAALPHMARLAPARVARHLQLLTDSFSATSAPGKDGLVRTFAALCSASVAYQKRLEPVLDLALGQADPKTLARWTEIVLPALKGEPHARARAVVEGRIGDLPRPIAQKLAEFLGIRLRRLAP